VSEKKKKGKNLSLCSFLNEHHRFSPTEPVVSFSWGEEKRWCHFFFKILVILVDGEIDLSTRNGNARVFP
jgi:hypothetical protein